MTKARKGKKNGRVNSVSSAQLTPSTSHKAHSALDSILAQGLPIAFIVFCLSIVLIVGMLRFGLFSSATTTGFKYLGIMNWSLTENGTYSLDLRNQVGSRITVILINATLGNQSIYFQKPTHLNAGKNTGNLVVGRFDDPLSRGTSFSITNSITYVDSVSGFNYTETGISSGYIG